MVMDRRREVMEAAAKGIREYLHSTRGAVACGPEATVVLDPVTLQLKVGCSNGDIIHIDSMET